jgi:hypothetical protein
MCGNAISASLQCAVQQAGMGIKEGEGCQTRYREQIDINAQRRTLRDVLSDLGRMELLGVQPWKREKIEKRNTLTGNQ